MINRIFHHAKKKGLPGGTKGFTANELLVVIAISTVLLALGIPNLVQWRENMKLTQTSRDVMQALQLARMRAIKENVEAIATFNTTGGEYEVYVDNGGGDDTKRGNFQKDTGEPIIKSDEVPSEVTMSVTFKNANPSLDSKTIAFNNRGEASGTGGVEMKNKQGKYMRVWIGSAVGNARVQTSLNGSSWE